MSDNPIAAPPGPPALMYHMPDAPILLAIGRVAILHGRLHDALAMLIKTLAEEGTTRWL